MNRSVQEVKGDSSQVQSHNVLRIIVDNMLLPVTLDTLYEVWRHTHRAMSLFLIFRTDLVDYAFFHYAIPTEFWEETDRVFDASFTTRVIYTNFC